MGKTASTQLEPAVRERCKMALTKRMAMGADSPPMRNRTISAAEAHAGAQWMSGCPSYALLDNKEYIGELAMDSHLSKGVQLGHDTRM